MANRQHQEATTARQKISYFVYPYPPSKSEWSVLFIGGRYYHHERSSDLLYKTHPLLRAAPQAMLSQTCLHSSSHLVVLSLGHDCRIFSLRSKMSQSQQSNSHQPGGRRSSPPHHILDKTSKKKRIENREKEADSVSIFFILEKRPDSCLLIKICFFSSSNIHRIFCFSWTTS